MKTETTSIARITAVLKEWECNEQRDVSGYEYEKTFVEMWRKLGAEIFQQSVGEIPGNRNLKKTSNQFRKSGGAQAARVDKPGRKG